MKISNVFIDLLMREWRIGERSRRVQTCVRRVLREMNTEAIQVLRNNPKVEIMVGAKPATRVLLVLSEAKVDRQPLVKSENELRDHLGHTLLYLRSPKSRNECVDAQREWRAATEKLL